MIPHSSRPYTSHYTDYAIPPPPTRHGTKFNLLTSFNIVIVIKFVKNISTAFGFETWGWAHIGFTMRTFYEIKSPSLLRISFPAMSCSFQSFPSSMHSSLHSFSLSHCLSLLSTRSVAGPMLHFTHHSRQVAPVQLRHENLKRNGGKSLPFLGAFRPHATTRPLPNGLSWNLIFEECYKICRENSSFIKIWRE
jgi:hypothetical protein